MLTAIKSAQKSVSLISYIFDNDASRKNFADALGRAAKRGVVVRVLAEAETSVQILTPNFMPGQALIRAQNLAALRGVLWLTPPPFDHSKLMIVDGHWVLLGSANWDARSLRLNFELNVEAYGRDFAKEMSQVIQEKLRGAREVTLAEVEGRSYPAKLRDSIARSLVLPYL